MPRVLLQRARDQLHVQCVARRFSVRPVARLLRHVRRRLVRFARQLFAREPHERQRIARGALATPQLALRLLERERLRPAQHVCPSRPAIRFTLITTTQKLLFSVTFPTDVVFRLPTCTEDNINVQYSVYDRTEVRLVSRQLLVYNLSGTRHLLPEIVR